MSLLVALAVGLAAPPPALLGLLTTPPPGGGFVLRRNDAELARLEHVTLEAPDRLVARSADGRYAVACRLHAGDRHLAVRLDGVTGIPLDPSYTLHFSARGDNTVRVLELDYMTQARSQVGRDSFITVDWWALYKQGSANPPGGFALYTRTSDDDEDELLLRLWVDESLPHPQAGRAWDLPTARAWVARFQQHFADRGQLVLDGANPAELLAGLRYAELAGVHEIYLFTHTWRGGFWPTDGTYTVNRTVFPRGEEDLRAFGEAVRQRGMFLSLHTVSGGIGFGDRTYLGTVPDRRLAHWGTGTLAQAVGAAEDRLLFRPAPGVRLPAPTRGRERPGVLPEYLHGNRLRIGNELVQVGAFTQTDQDVWVLTGVRRGQCGSVAQTHPSGDDVACLIAAYDVNFVPDNDSSLLPELAAAYAGLLNRCQVDRTEYDGAEIHRYEGLWGYHKFATLVYQQLDHPVIAHDSSGGAPPCCLEYRFNASRRLLRGTDAAAHGSYNAPLVLDGWHQRPASNLLEANFVLSLGAMDGGTALGVGRPFPMFGVTVQELQAHGLSEQFCALVREWRAASRQMTDGQREALRATLRRGYHGGHPGSPVVHELRRAADHWNMVPVRVLTRRTGDILWHREQENGAFGPKQVLAPGESVELENPNAAQPPRVVLRVLAGTLTDPVLTVGSGRLSLTGTVAAGEYLQYGGGTEATLSDRNWQRLRTLAAHTEAFVAATGWQPVAVGGQSTGPVRLELQLLTDGTPLVVPFGPDDARRR